MDAEADDDAFDVDAFDDDALDDDADDEVNFVCDLFVRLYVLLVVDILICSSSGSGFTLFLLLRPKLICGLLLILVFLLLDIFTFILNGNWINSVPAAVPVDVTDIDTATDANIANRTSM